MVGAIGWDNRTNGAAPPSVVVPELLQPISNLTPDAFRALKPFAIPNRRALGWFVSLQTVGAIVRKGLGARKPLGAILRDGQSP